MRKHFLSALSLLSAVLIASILNASTVSAQDHSHSYASASGQYQAYRTMGHFFAKYLFFGITTKQDEKKAERQFWTRYYKMLRNRNHSGSNCAPNSSRVSLVCDPDWFIFLSLMREQSSESWNGGDGGGNAN